MWLCCAAAISASRQAETSAWSAGTQASTSPSRAAVGPSMFSPAAVSSTAAAGPIKRARRTVPPHAGSRPSFTSGHPRLVCGESVATLRSQARASSRPPPRQMPSMIATLGHGWAESREKTARPAAHSRSISSGGMPCSRSRRAISAPAKNEPSRVDWSTIAAGGGPASTLSSARDSSVTASAVSTFWAWSGTKNEITTPPSSRRSSVSVRKGPAGLGAEAGMAVVPSGPVGMVFACSKRKNR